MAKSHIDDEPLEFHGKEYLKLNENKFKTLCLNVKNRVQNSEINDFLYNIPKETKKILNNQENALNLNQKYKSEKGLLERVLSNRSKKSYGDLLINRTDTFRQKKEIKESYEEHKPLDQRYGNNTWVMGLRRPNNFKGLRYCYVNAGSDINPIWRKVKEIVKVNEKISVPHSEVNRKDLEPFMKGDYFKSKNKFIRYDENSCLKVNKYY